jgi:trk system potassium uptake protein TrkH
MNYKYVLYSVGKLLQILALTLAAPALIALFETGGNLAARITHPNPLGFLAAMAASAAAGTAMVAAFRKNKGRIDAREGFAIVTFSWLAAALVGALPFFILFVSRDRASPLSAWTDAMFETMSGLTTMGATVIADVESLPKSILFWRVLTHWLGGMGIVTLALALFPAFGVAAYQMFRGEMTGPSKERLRPRLAQTAVILWGVYAFFTLLETVLLMAGNMPFFDAVCHSFSTMATGGFSTRNASVAYFDSAYIEWVITAFMILGGTNFFIHYRIIFHNDWGTLKGNREFRLYAAILVGASALCAIFILVHGIQTPQWAQSSFKPKALSATEAAAKIAAEQERIAAPHDLIRHSAFHAVSIVTTTGFVAADWNMWPHFTRVMFFILMFFGGCAGSTSGGIKMIRLLVLLKTVTNQARTLVQARRVRPLKIGSKVLNESQVSSILSFFALYMMLFAAFSAVMAAIVPDFTTAVTSVAAALGGIGPGLAGVGAFETYGWLPIHGKWTLIACMLLGRLEIYTVLIALSPASWRR